MKPLRNKLANSWPALVIALLGYALCQAAQPAYSAVFLGFGIGAFVAASSWPRQLLVEVPRLYGALVDVLNVYYERYAPSDRLNRISEEEAAMLLRSAQQTATTFKEAVMAAPTDLWYAVYDSPRWEPSGMKPDRVAKS